MTIQKLFLQFLNMSLMASIVIVVVVLLRLILKKAPKNISYALWSLVMFRLVFPFSFESIFSLLPSSNPLPQEVLTSQAPVINSGIPVLDQSINLPAPVLGDTVNPMQILLFIGAIFWIAGVAILMTYSIVSYLLLKRKVRTAMLLDNNIYECESITSPFVLGIIKPKIYLPMRLSDKEKKYILKHEQIHIKRLDTLMKPLAFLILCIHWFNPLCWLAFMLMSKDMELYCDESVIKQMGSDIKLDYSTALLSLATTKKIPNGYPLAFGESNVKARIKNVLNYKKTAFWVIVVTIIIVIAVGIGLLTNPKSNTENSTIDKNISNKIISQIKLDNGFDLQLVLTNGKNFSREESVIGGNVYETNFQGEYEIQVLKNEELISKIIHKDLLPISFDGNTLNFPGEFKLNVTDYNGDGDTDFSLGQWASSNLNVFLLLSVDSTGKLRFLPVSNNGINNTLLASDKNFSAQFLQVSDSDFTFLQYDNSIGGNIIYTAKWNGGNFDITQNEIPPHPLPWAQNITENDVSTIELLISPSLANEHYKKYSADEFPNVIKIINQSNGEFLPYNETLDGIIQTLYITTIDGQKHTITNAGNTYLIIDGQYYKGDPAILSNWNFKGNETIPNSFYQSKTVPDIILKDGELSPNDFIDEIVKSFQIKEGVARFVVPNKKPSGYELSQLSILVSGYIPIENNSNISLHAYEKENNERKWQLKKEYIEKIFDADVPDGTEVYIHVSLMEKDGNTFFYGGNSKKFPLREDHFTPNTKINSDSITFIDKFNDTLKLSLNLPTGWSMKVSNTSSQVAPSVDIYIGSSLIGDVSCSDFDFDDLDRSENGDIYYMYVYSGIMMGSMASWDGEYTEITKTKNSAVGMCKPWHRIDVPNVSGAALANEVEKGILAYDANFLKYVAISLNDNAVTEEQWESIAKSVKLSR